MVPLHIIPRQELQRVQNAPIDGYERLALLADMCRLNTLVSVKRAGSGHLGSSFSSLDIVTSLYYHEMNVRQVGLTDPNRDVYFSSKGHDAPGLYSVLYGLGILPFDLWINLRRSNGTCGHPDISLPGVETNSGSLGMGISKAKGIAWAKRLKGSGGRVFVMTGDGELQEGQIFEALQTAAHQKITNLHVIVDHNKVQSEKEVKETIDLGDLEEKFRAFGWHVGRCNGHDVRALETAFAEMKTVTDRPKILIADTLKGRGVSFMEHPAALAANRGLYKWHAGARDDESFRLAYAELHDRVQAAADRLGLPALRVEAVSVPEAPPAPPAGVPVAQAYGRALAEFTRERDDVVVISADLASDCQLREFERDHPDRFIENGIAEQDAVSMAGGLALEGFLPVLNSFASFLAARPNEQIYNNGTERTRIVYACHYAGLIPAGPGHTHQSVRDISLFAALPNFVILQPCNAAETRLAVKYCLEESRDNCVLRMNLGPSPSAIDLPDDYRLQEGRGVVLHPGRDAVLFAYGPVLLNEALRAAEILHANGRNLRVVNMPWLNRADPTWLASAVEGCSAVFVLDDHSIRGGLGDSLLRALAADGLLQGKSFQVFGVEEYPAWGTVSEALQYHRLDRHSLAERVARSPQPNRFPVS